MTESNQSPAEAEDGRLAEAERFVLGALAGDAGQLPPSVLLRAYQELLRQARYLLGVVTSDAQLADKDLRIRPEDQRAPLVAAILAELPAAADDFDRAVAAGLAEFGDDTCEIVTGWLRQARAEGDAR